MKKITLILLLFNIQQNVLADSDSQINLDIGISHDNNINRSHSKQSTLDSTAYHLLTSFSRVDKIALKQLLEYRASLGYQDLQDYDGTDHIRGSMGISLRYKPGSSFTSPTYIIEAETGLADFQADLRDRTHYLLRFIISSWLTSQLQFNSGIASQLQDSDSRAFDLVTHKLFFSADLRLDQFSTLYATATYQAGDITSSIPLSDSSTEILDIIRQAEDIEFDPSFGNNILAYRIDSRAIISTLGYNLAFAPGQSIDLSAQYVSARAKYGIDYDALSFNLSYLISFGL